MSMIERVIAKAKSDVKTIVFPEGNEERTILAAERLMKEGIARPILLGDPEDISAFAVRLGADLTGITTMNPLSGGKFEKYAAALYEIRKNKGVTQADAENLCLDPMYYGIMMVKMGDADGMVSGACHSTADTLRPCLQILKTAPGTKLVSAFFLMVVPDCEYGENGTFVFSDCGLNQNPTSEELAAIANSSAQSFRVLTGKEPKVAFLSYSTMGSAKHDDVTKVQEAVKIAKELYPDLNCDGEMQLDAAIVPKVGESKAPNSKIAGHANTLIFPNLDAGNIGYKLTQRLAKAEAYGPVTQGIAAPVNDLSRGCSADDIVGVAAITAVQCQLQ